MTTRHEFGKGLAKVSAALCSHAAAIAGGLILMLLGIAMGVSIVLLPIGIPVGFVGLGLVLWGLFGRSRNEQTTA